MINVLIGIFYIALIALVSYLLYFIIKTAIKENVNPRKWVCVGVEEDDVIVKNKGNLIIVIIVEDENTRNKIEEGFDNL